MNTIVFALLLLIPTSFADDQCNISNINHYYRYIKDNGPNLREVEKQKEQIGSEIDVAAQRPNPQIDMDYLKGNQFGVDISNYTFSAQHIIEFGAKRDKRISKAKAYKTLNDTQLELNLYNANSQAALLYQKVAQLEILIESVKEATNTFEKVIKKLASRKRLNPEETVSLSTLTLASNDYKAQLNDLENQKNLLEGQLEFFSNCVALKPKYHQFQFPETKDLSSANSTTSLNQLEDFKVKLAHEELEVQKSLGYSNIQLGPKLEYQNQGSDSSLSAGLSISFALPLFQTNDGGKLRALNALRTQKIKSANAKGKLAIQRKNLVSQYVRSLNTYKRMPTLKELERTHHEVESLFARGVVSIPMTIESHRQQVDFLKSRFETENDLLSTYISINLIDGDLLGFEKLIK